MPMSRVAKIPIVMIIVASGMTLLFTSKQQSKLVSPKPTPTSQAHLDSSPEATLNKAAIHPPTSIPEPPLDQVPAVHLKVLPQKPEPTGVLVSVTPWVEMRNPGVQLADFRTLGLQAKLTF